MSSLYDTRRYLTNFDSSRTGNIITDVLVIGSGVAGARAALAAADDVLVTLMTKGAFDESATQHAQGGIAASLTSPDSPKQHFDDTVRVGCHLNDNNAVRLLVTEGPACIEELIRWGLALDREGEELALTREGGHSLSRIVHAQGDQTGRALVATLQPRVRQTDNIRVFEHCFLVDLLTVDGVCVGAVAFHQHHGHQLIWAKQTILATGGCGQLWRETTNPAVATGDGLAAACRAGATLRDMEMMQFHPTTLYVAGAGRALISEAVRGEGGILVDAAGERFMVHFHRDGELAPRDVVSRAIHRHLASTRANCVYLDVRHITGFKARFPLIARLCGDFEIDVSRDLIPVRPSAHYMIGGVETALDGSSGVEGLLCCGEVSCTGVHGANRLASNSLLEGLVFGRMAGRTAARRAGDSSHAGRLHRVANRVPASTRTPLDLFDMHSSLRSIMWRNAGIVRTPDRLLETCDILNFWGHYTLDKTLDEVPGWEMQDQLTVARIIAMCALERTESVGVHYRADAPEALLGQPYHVIATRDAGETTIRRVDHVTSAPLE